MYRDLTKVLNDPKLSLQLAILLKNMDTKEGKFRFPGVSEKGKKEEQKKTKSVLLAGKEGNTPKPAQSSVAVEQGSSLFDYF